MLFSNSQVIVGIHRSIRAHLQTQRLLDIAYRRILLITHNNQDFMDGAPATDLDGCHVSYSRLRPAAPHLALMAVGWRLRSL